MGLWDGYDSFGDRINFDSWSWTPWAPEGTDTGDWTRQNLGGYTSPNQELLKLGVGGQVGASSDAARQAANDYKWKYGQKALNALAARPYRFNAPLHPSMRKVPGGSPYDVHHGSGDLRVDWPEKSGRKPWKWRVGQLVADAATAAYKPGDYRYGFRFLYNPSSIQFSTPLTSKLSPSALADSSGADVKMMPQGSITLELFLNRVMDVTQPTDNYQTGKGQKIAPEDLAELQERGTMYDIDYLYRTINGMWSLDETAGPVKKPKKKKGKKKDKDIPDPDMTQTGDIGMLLPTSAWLSIGRAMRYYGWVQSITYTHEMFSEDMVPLVTRLQLSFARILTGSPGDFEAIDNASAIARAASGNNFEPKTASTGAGAGAAAGVAGGAGYPDDQGKESNEFYIWNSVVRAGFSKATAGGILGNFEQESGFDPTIDQSGGNDMHDGSGFGIAQWTWSERQDPLRKFAQGINKSYKTLEAQVGYLIKEMKSGSFGSVSKYKSFSDPVDACVYFHDEYEGSADSDAFVREKRGGDARKWFNKFKNKVPAPTSAASTSVSSVFVLGDSLTVGSAPYIRRGYKGSSMSVTIDAEVSRHSSELGPLANDAARSASLWIIALGTNDYSGPDLKDNVRKVMNKAGGKSVRWINIYNDSNHPQTKTINNALDDMGREYSNLMIIDYAGRLNKSHLDSSGYHLTDTGYRERAKLYVVTVVGSTSLSRIGG
jgi:hypothetical protein